MQKILFARISDNVLDDDDWGIARLVLRDGVVAEQAEYTGRPLKPAYKLPVFVGMTVVQLAEWSRHDTTGHHPEEYHELASDAAGPGAFRDFWNAEEIESC